MNCLLVSGFRDTGKNTIVVQLGNFLLARGYDVIIGDAIPPTGSRNDFRSVMEHRDTHRRVLLNTASDYEGNANQLLEFYWQQTAIDMLIATIRDAHGERTAMWAAIQLLQPIQLVEVPLAKISGQRSDFGAALANYLDRIGNLCHFILIGQPFNI
jgi:hypothetical protein